MDKKNRPVGAKAVVTLFPSSTQPPVEASAAGLTIPGLVVTSAEDAHSLRSNAVALAQAWPGAELRYIAKAKAGGCPSTVGSADSSAWAGPAEPPSATPGRC